MSASLHHRLKRKKDPDHDAAMSFAEIGAAMGFTWQRAQQLYSSGMKKLRAHPEELARLQILAAELAAAREARLRCIIGW